MTQVVEQLRQLKSEVMGRAIRYVSLDSWEKAVSSNQLVPQTTVAPDHQLGLPEWAYRKHIFAIDANELTKWTGNEQFPYLVNKLMFYIKIKAHKSKRRIVELSFDVKASDEPCVLDFACRVESLYEDNIFKKSRNFLQGYYFGATKEWKNYVMSRVPYADYKGNYSLPEIVIQKPIDSDRFKVERVFD